MYSRKNRPYTLMIITNDSTVMNNDPRIVTAHSGMLSQNPTSVIFCFTRSGSAAVEVDRLPNLLVAACITPWQILKIASIMSMP